MVATVGLSMVYSSADFSEGHPMLTMDDSALATVVETEMARGRTVATEGAAVALG